MRDHVEGAWMKGLIREHEEVTRLPNTEGRWYGAEQKPRADLSSPNTSPGASRLVSTTDAYSMIDRSSGGGPRVVKSQRYD